MNESLIKDDVAGRYPDYLRDESRRTGCAESISFPQTERDIVDIMKSTSGSITVQGARTGIAAGAVPEGGHIINLSRMTAITGMRATGTPDAPFAVTVQPGLTLADLRSAIKGRAFKTDGWSAESKRALAAFTGSELCFFPPDPTEDTAALGGMVSCNASGSRSFKYGSIRNYVSRLRAVTSAGDVIHLTRGAERANGREFSISGASSTINGVLPGYEIPKVKNASGYFVAPDMSLIDLLIGAEGTLAVISEAELILQPAPFHNWAIMAFLPDTDSAIDYVGACRQLENPAVAALEFFDEKAVHLLRRQKVSNPAFGFLPELKEEWNVCVYVELDGRSEQELESAAMAIAELIETRGGSEDATWMATEAAELERMKKFRHALPEAVNLTIDKYRRTNPAITKLGTDFSVPDECLKQVMSMYRTDLSQAGLDYVIFGHIGNNHVHVNILPSSIHQFDAGKALYLNWARAVVQMGGTVSAEHGVGKIKTALLAEMFGDEGIAEMRALKVSFDPENRLNRGNLFPAES